MKISHQLRALSLLALFCGGASTPLLASASVAPLPALVQDDELPDEREDIEERIDQFKKHIKKRGEEDREAIGLVDELLTEFPGCGPKDREDIVKDLAKGLDVKRKEVDGAPDNRLFLAIATALGEMGPESAGPLAKYIGHKRLKNDLAVQRRLILSLGKTKVESGVKTLVGLLNHKDATLIGASAEALANHDELELKKRKDVFEDLLKSLMSHKAAVDADVNDIIAKERYDVVAAPIITTLKRLSKHDDARTPEDWQRWWNKNKRSDWDALDD